jgi:hypothetical protein
MRPGWISQLSNEATWKASSSGGALRESVVVAAGMRGGRTKNDVVSM